MNKLQPISQVFGLLFFFVNKSTTFFPIKQNIRYTKTKKNMFLFVFKTFLLILHQVNYNNNLHMNEFIQLNKWWASLRISDKEKISGQPYPDCTSWWNNLDLTEKSKDYHKSGIERAARQKSRGFT